MTGLFFVVAELMEGQDLKPICYEAKPGVRVVYFDIKHFDNIKKRWEEIGSTVGWTDVCALGVDNIGVSLIINVPVEND